MRQNSYETQFNPLSYLPDGVSSALRGVLIAQNVDIPMKLKAFHRRTHWALAVPVGVFHNDYRLDDPTPDDIDRHRGERELLLLDAHKNLRARYGAVRRPWLPRSDVLELDGHFCYTLATLQIFAEYSKARSFFTAAAAFIKAANNDFTLIRPDTHNTTPFTPIEERITKFGSMVRGPEWTEDEDTVLRRWFGQRTIGDCAGKHVKLTPEEWEIVLAALRGRRTEMSVRHRISVLNKRLHDEMSVDGYVARTRLREYMARVLGERPRQPRMYSKKRRSRRTDALASRPIASTT